MRRKRRWSDWMMRDWESFQNHCVCRCPTSDKFELPPLLRVFISCLRSSWWIWSERLTYRLLLTFLLDYLTFTALPWSSGTTRAGPYPLVLPPRNSTCSTNTSSFSIEATLIPPYGKISSAVTNYNILLSCRIPSAYLPHMEAYRDSESAR